MLPGDGRGGAGAFEAARRLRRAEKLKPPEEGDSLGHLDPLVHMGDEQNFVYQIWLPSSTPFPALPRARLEVGLIVWGLPAAEIDGAA